MNDSIDAPGADCADVETPIRGDGPDRGGRPRDPREWLAGAEPVDAAELLEMLCGDQVERWRAGERIPAEAYLALHPTLCGGNDAAFELIYGEYLIRESLGESPKLEEFCWRFPDFAGRFRRQLDLHRALGEAPPETEIDLGGDAGPEREGALAVPLVPGFEILGILGQGGMSVVYLARQVGLNRLVAIKVIRARVYADPEVAARFRDEAEVAARFQHSHIIQVYEVGEFEGQGYLVLEYAAGGSLQQKLGGDPQPPREAARLIELLARALHYAHQRGVVHRDLKPANVVLTEDGVPKVTDFGLAKLMEREAGLTRTGDIMGTPSYMAPEQASGTPADVTAAADLYALGAILYEMLTGRPPFKGSTPLSTLSQAAEEEALAPGRLQRHLPREIETICLKCLEKDPRRRYASALDLAEDLRRFLEGRPILARRISQAERLWRWCRREPAKATLAAGLVLAIIGGFLGVAAQKRRAEVRAVAEARERARAELAEGKALDNLYFSQIAQVRLEWQLDHIPTARELLERCDPRRRGWEWSYLNHVSHPELLTIAVDPAMTFVNAVAFSPDGRRLAFTAFNPYGVTEDDLRHPVEIWETSPPRRIRRLEAPGTAGCLSFSPDGRRLAASGPQGARVWEVATGAEVLSWPPIGAVTYSPDGKALVSCRDHRVVFRDPDSGRPLREFTSDSGRVIYRPDGRVIAVSGPAAVELRDVASGRELRRLPHGPVDHELQHNRFFGEEGPHMAFSPDGRWLAVATDPPRVWDAISGESRHQLNGHDGPVPGIAFSPDGRQIATAGVDSTIRLWDARTGFERSVLRGHSSWAGCVAFHPEGWCLLSGSRQGAEVKLWDLTRHPEHVSLGGTLPTALHFDPDGRSLRVIGPHGRLYRRDVDGTTTEMGRRVDLSPRWQTPATFAEFSADGRRLVTVADDRKLIKLWDAEDGRELGTFRGLSLDATHVSISHDGGRVAAMAANMGLNAEHRDVIAWDCATGQVLALFRPNPAPTVSTHGRVALDGEGSRIAFDVYDDAAFDPVGRVPRGNPRAFIEVHEVDGGRELLRLPMPDAGLVFSLAFSPDGTRLAAGDRDRMKVWVWDVRTGRLLHETLWNDMIFQLAFSPDGRRLAGVSRSKVQLRDVADGREILSLSGAPSRASDGGFNPVVAWSPDGTGLAATNWDGSVSVWAGIAGSIPARERWGAAERRVFAWHLGEAEAAIAAGQAGAAGLHLDRIRRAEPPDARSLLRRAEVAVKLRLLDEADADFARWLAGGAAVEQDAYLSYARLFLIRGDRPGYRRLLGRFLDSCEQGADPDGLEQLGRMVGLAPCPVAVAERVVRLLRIPFPEPAGHRTHQFSLGLAYHRAGHRDAARTALNDFRTHAPHGAWLTHPVMAMIEHDLGHVREADLELARARETLDRWREHEASGGGLLDPNGFEYDLLYREACSRIGPKK
jgi:WD40 repeat protein/tRNA A-37 threonylcarbamoyl transferase component Bud32